MAKIESDRQLLARLGFSDAEAADFLDRSRQAVNAVLGGSSKRKGYLKPVDILVLRMAAKAGGHAVDDEAVIDYVRQVHGQKAADKVRTGFGLLAAPPDLAGVSEAWIVIPDFARLRRQAPEHAETIRRLPHDFPDTTLVYLCGTPIQETALREFVCAGLGGNRLQSISVLAENVVGAQQTMLILDPRGPDPQVFVLVASGFIRSPLVSGSSIASYLASVVAELRLLPAIADDQEKRSTQAKRR